MLFDYSKTDPSQNYKLMSQTIIPRPIAWIVTEGDGVVNVAPFSYFTGLSSKPPTVIVSIGHKSDGTPKDTLANIRKHRKCTVCMVAPGQMRTMHYSSKEISSQISEAEEFNIPLKSMVEGFPPVVEGTPSAFFCELFKEVELPGSKTIPLILEIKRQFVDDEAIVDKERLRVRFEPLARVGRYYTTLAEDLIPPKIP